MQRDSTDVSLTTHIPKLYDEITFRYFALQQIDDIGLKELVDIITMNIFDLRFNQFKIDFEEHRLKLEGNKPVYTCVELHEGFFMNFFVNISDMSSIWRFGSLPIEAYLKDFLGRIKILFSQG